MMDLKQRVLAAVAAEPSPRRSETSRKHLVVLAGATLASVAVFMIAGGVRPTGRPLELWVATSIGAMTVAAGALLLSVRRGRSMLGRSSSLLLGLAVVTPALLLLWKLAWSSGFAGMNEAWPERMGLRCLLLGMATGLPPMLAFFSMWRGTSPAHPRLTGLALGIAAGAFTWVLVDLWCPVGHVSHLLLGHVLPMALYALGGFAAGGFLEPRRG